jgi:hypothetical protein
MTKLNAVNIGMNKFCGPDMRLFDITIQARVNCESYQEAVELSNKLSDIVEDRIIKELNLQFDVDVDVTNQAEEVKV